MASEHLIELTKTLGRVSPTIKLAARTFRVSLQSADVLLWDTSSRCEDTTAAAVRTLYYLRRPLMSGLIYLRQLLVQRQ